MQRAMYVAWYGQGQPLANYQSAEQQLLAARRLAEGFRFEVRPIDEKLKGLAEMRSRLPGAPPSASGAVAQAPGTARVSDSGIPPGATAEGLRLLEASRMELRAGKTGEARKLAEMAYMDEARYGVKERTTFLRARRSSRPGDDVTDIVLRALS